MSSRPMIKTYVTFLRTGSEGLVQVMVHVGYKR